MHQYVACPEQLHRTANHRRCAGTHYVDGMMLLVRTAEMAGWIEPWTMACGRPGEKDGAYGVF